MSEIVNRLAARSVHGSPRTQAAARQLVNEVVAESVREVEGGQKGSSSSERNLVIDEGEEGPGQAENIHTFTEEELQERGLKRVEGEKGGAKEGPRVTPTFLRRLARMRNAKKETTVKKGTKSTTFRRVRTLLSFSQTSLMKSRTSRALGRRMRRVARRPLRTIPWVVTLKSWCETKE